MCSTCKGGGGTSGKGRTTYTPKKAGSAMFSGKKSTGSSSTSDGRASTYGTPMVRASFGRRK